MKTGVEYVKNRRFLSTVGNPHNYQSILVDFRCFSLQHTLDSGQFFRYEKKGDWYHCQERDKDFKIRQKGKILEFEGTTAEHIKKLFGLNCNYNKIIKELSKDKTLLPAIRKYKGLRVMQRDPWETLISFQCSIFSNIKKIKLNMNCIVREFGKKGRFPSPGKINDLQKIKKCATGFRAKYIHAANSLVDDSYFEKLKKKKYENSLQELMELPGVGEKVADCICLFSLGKTEAFPIDVWIQRMMTNMYFNGKKTKCQEPQVLEHARKFGVSKYKFSKFPTMKEIKKFAIQRWGKNAGYAQQFIYHWGRHL